jgi:hypothetical protein
VSYAWFSLLDAVGADDTQTTSAPGVFRGRP